MATAGEIGYWLYWLLGLLFLLACSALTWWGLFGDRARGRRRCPRCWYDMTGTPGRLCPECGREARHEKSLFRARRRLLPAAAGALAASLGVTWTIEQNRNTGWMSMVPTRLLVACLPLAGARDSLLVEEIEARGGRRTLTAAQWESIADRCVSGDFRARPATERWQQKYGRLVELVDSQAPLGLDVGSRLLQLPPYLNVRSDRPWPAGVTPCLQLQLRHWWPAGTECRLELSPEWGAEAPLVFDRNNPRSRSGYALVVPAEAAADGRIHLQAVVKRRDAPRIPGTPGTPGTGTESGTDPAQWQTVLARAIDVPITVTEESLEEMIAPEVDPAVQEAVREVFSLGVVKWATGPSPLRVRYDPAPTRRSSFDGLAIGARVEIFRESVLARRLDIWWRAGVSAQSQRGSGFRVDYEDLALVSQANQEDGLWQMTVRGDPLLALRAGEASRYWAGEFTLPLKVDRHRRTAPPREWETQQPNESQTAP